MNENDNTQNFDSESSSDFEEVVNSEDEVLNDISGETEKYDDVDVIEEKENKITEGIAEPFVSVKYNHRNRNLSKDEAIQLIQKGLHTESLRNKLEYAAECQGVDINELVDKIVTAPENAYKNYLEKMYGEGSSEVDIGMEIYRQKQSDKYKKILQDREKSDQEKREIERKENVNLRLADEYLALKSNIPNAPEYSKLPNSVIIEAAEGKRDLYSAYLHYLYNEKMKIDAAKTSEKIATNASAGTMKNKSGENTSSADRNFLSGLWSR